MSTPKNLTVVTDIPNDGLDDLISVSGPSSHECSVGWVLTQIGEPTAERLRLALTNPAATNRRISDWFRSHGWDISPVTVSRHRSGGCSNCTR